MTRQDIIDAIKDTTYLSECVDTTWLEANPEEVIDEDMLQRYIDEHEIIYYSNAMEFLRDEDPSLSESMELAAEYCCELKDINSELLATILFQEKARQELSSIDLDIEEE